MSLGGFSKDAERFRDLDEAALKAAQEERPPVFLYHCANPECRRFAQEWETSMSPVEHRVLTGEPARCFLCMAIAAFRWKP